MCVCVLHMRESGGAYQRKCVTMSVSAKHVTDAT
jgi:hypothetical protein